jgi:hypothetical protein
MNRIEAILKTAVSIATVLLLAIGTARAQQQVNLSAGPTMTTLPDGMSVHMWGYTCGASATDNTIPSEYCHAANQAVQAANIAAGSANNFNSGMWSPVVITVTSGQDLQINLTNNLTFTSTGASTPNNIPTSIVIVGQLGGGLGSGGTSVASPPHNIQGTTWPIANTSAIFAPPSQNPRVQSFGTEVAVGTTATPLTWKAPAPGTYLLESGTHPSIQATMGLVGMVVVTTAPSSGAGTAYPGVSYNADVPLLFSEIDPIQNELVNAAVNTAGFNENAVRGNSGGPVSSVVVTNGGSGYMSPPTVIFDHGKVDATATAVIDTTAGSPTIGQVIAVKVTNGGVYASEPSITFQNAMGDPGSGATATATITGPNSVALCNSAIDPVTLKGGLADACYPSVVNYTPRYFLINGAAFDKTNISNSQFMTSPATGVSGPQSVLVRMVNAGSRMHVPAIVNSSTAGAGGFSLIAEDGNPLPGQKRVQSEVFLAAGKTYDVMIDTPPTGSNALAVFDRQLSLSANGVNHDAGMLGYISVNGAGLPVSSGTATANPDTYNAVVAGQTLTVSDPSKGLIANDINIFGVKVMSPGPTQGTLKLHADGTFTYAASSGWSGSDSFTYCGNGATSNGTSSTGPCTTVTLGPPEHMETASNIHCTSPSFTSTLATKLKASAPGVLASCKDDAGYPLTVSVTSVSQNLTLTLDANGGFIASVPSANTYTFVFSAKNSQGVTGDPVTATLTFLPGSGLQVTVLDGADKHTQITDYRWIIEEDRTFFVDPACAQNPTASGCTANNVVTNFGTNFHTSFMPVIATGCTGDTSCGNDQTFGGQPVTPPTHTDPSAVALDPNKRYYISVLPGDAAQPFIAGFAGSPDCSPSGTIAGNCGHGMGGAPIPKGPHGSQSITVLTEPSPYPTATLSVFVFEDDHPLNGEHDAGGGIDTLSPNEPGLGGFQITLQDDAGGTGDATGTPTYDMFNMPLSNSLAGTIDPVTGKDACPLSTQISKTSEGGDSTLNGVVGMIITCPTFESDGVTLSPLAGQAVVKNLYQGRYGVVANPGADRIARGEEWLQTNTLDGQKAHDSFMRIGEPAYFQEFGPAGYHVTIGFANPQIINNVGKQLCKATACTPEVKGHVTTARMSRTPDERLYGSGSHDAYAFSQCYVSIGDPDGAEFGFTKCDDQGNFDFPSGTVPAGNWKITTFDQWNDQVVDGISTPVGLGTAGGSLTSISEAGNTVTVTVPGTGLVTGQTVTISGVTPADYNGTFVITVTGSTPATSSSPGSTTFTYNLPTTAGLGAGNGGSATAVVDMGEVAVHQWQSNIYTRTFLDINGDGISNVDAQGNPLEPGLPLVATNIRFRDGSFSNFNNTDLNGYAGFNEVFPLFNWYVIETDSTRFKNTGTHVVYDSGGPVDGSSPGGVSCSSASPTTKPCGSSTIGNNLANTYEPNPLPADLSIPGAVYCGDADCSGMSIASGPSPSALTKQSTGRIDPPSVTPYGSSYGWQGYSGQNNFLEFGKKPFADGENGGIHGHVVYASTRPFDDPQLLLQLSWEPLVPNVTINLYKEGTAADGVTQTLTLVDSTVTSSFDDWAQGFRSGNKPNMNCPGQGTDPNDPNVSSLMHDPYFWFTLKNQPQWLDAYNNNGTPAHTLPYESQYKCYDGMHNWNQLQPAPYDGMYSFPSVTSVDQNGRPNGTNCTICIANPTVNDPNDPKYDPFRYGTKMLPDGKYVVEVVVPSGYELVKEEDKNILIGDNFIAPVTQQFAGLGAIFILPDQAEIAEAYNKNNAQNPTDTLGRDSGVPSHEGDTGSIETFWPCVGEMRPVPDFISIFPASQEVAPFAGAMRPLCDRKEVTLTTGTSALAKFYIFTETHKASHFTGVITDDFTAEFDPYSPQFGEKFAPAYLPISFKDWTGNEISRVYTDAWGAYNGLNYSTWEVNPPNPTGYGPTMMVGCMNDAGPIPDPKNPGQFITDPLFQTGYSDFCYELPFMPGQTGYFDTPVVPTSAFAGGYNTPDCSYPDATPAVKSVIGQDGVAGPWVAAAGHQLTITALGDQAVDNYGYSGPGVTTDPYGKQKITRHYGFGSQCLSPTASSATCNTLSTVTVGGVNAIVGSWSDTSITVTVPGPVPSICTIASSTCNPTPVPTCTIQQQAQYGNTASALPPGQSPTARCGELVITAGNGKQSIDTVTVTIGGKTPTVLAQGQTIQNAIDLANPGDTIIVPPGTYSEMLLMWKPLRLQGVGAASSIIDASPHPAGRLDPWRRQVVCLFGLALNGIPISSANPYDQSTTFSCSPDMQFSVDRLPLEATVGWDATLNGNLAEQLIEPTLMGAFEGAGITVLAKGVRFPAGSNPFASDVFPTGTALLTPGDCLDSTGKNPFPSNFLCNPSSIDGLTVKNSSQGGGGILVHGWGHDLQIANNRVLNNQGTLSGGITVGQGEHPDAYLNGAVATTVPGSCILNPPRGTPANLALPFCFDRDVNVHNNQVVQNSSLGDELFSSTPAGAGGVTFCSGSDYYKFNFNWVCGNMSTGDGAGVVHLGLTYDGDIEHNTILFNESTNPTIVTNGGGLLIMGAPDVDPPCGVTTDQDCVSPANTVTPSDGVGPGLVINANLIQGNSADSGSGGGLRLQHINGNEIINFPNGSVATTWPDIPGHNENATSTSVTSPRHWQALTRWNQVSVTNNIISNNVAGWDGGGVSILDGLDVNFVNNTIISNNSTASSGVLFQTLFAPLASTQGNNCTKPFTPQGTTSQIPGSCPQVAGLVSVNNSEVLIANLPTGVVCPTGHGTNSVSSTANCKNFSVPILYNNVFWKNRAFMIGVGGLGSGLVNQQNVVGIYDPHFSGSSLSPKLTASQSTSGSCDDNVSDSYWDIGVRGDHYPGDHTGGTLSPQYSVLTNSNENGGGANNLLSPTAVVNTTYCNGSRVPPESGGSGWAVPPGTNESNALPAPPFTLLAGATVDEGNNWINLRWGPLSMVTTPADPTAAKTRSDPNLSSNPFSPAIDYVPNTSATFAFAPTKDFFGHNRPDVSNSPIDIGAIEFQATTPILKITGGPLTFVNVVVGTTSAAQTLTMTNTGVGQASGIVIAVTSPFSRPTGTAGGTCGATLNSGTSCTINVVFTPANTTPATGSVTVTSTAPTVVQGSPVGLSGTGINAIRTATVSPSPLAFGNWATGTTSNPLNLTVTNTGNIALAGGTFTFGGVTPQPYSRVTTGTFPGNAPNCGVTLALGAACTIKVQFAPTTTGALNRTLTVAFTGATVTPASVSLTGTGVAARAAVSITPNPLVVTLPTGRLSGSGTVTFRNTAAAGGSNVAVTNVTVSGSGVIWAWTKGTDNCTGVNLAPGGTCTVQATFSRLGSAGTHNGTITFTDTGTGSPQSATLSGVAQ